MAKKYLRLALILLITVSCLYVLSNLWDRDLKPGEFYSQNDLLPLSNKPGNGFYRIWTLWLPKARNIETDSAVKKIRDFYTNGDNMLPETAKDLANTIVNLQDVRHLALPEQLPFEPREPGQLCRLVLSHRDEIVKLRNSYSFVLERFKEMVHHPYIQDLNPLHLIEKPFPRLKPWITMTRIYSASAVLTALEGEWQKGITVLISLLRFSRNYLESSRSLIAYTSASASAAIALSAIIELANHRDCPDSILQYILDRMSPLTEKAFSSKNQMVAEYLSTIHALDRQLQTKLQSSGFKWFLGRLFYSPERTRYYFYQLFSWYIDYDRTPPYRWGESPRYVYEKLVTSRVSGWFWWWRNPVGKKIFFSISPAIINHVGNTHRFRSLYGMTRLAAIIKLRHRSGMPWLQAVDPPEIQHSVDPFSGKRFLYISSGQYLCSVGPNGQLDIDTATSSDDIRVPCKLN